MYYKKNKHKFKIWSHKLFCDDIEGDFVFVKSTLLYFELC